MNNLLYIKTFGAWHCYISNLKTIYHSLCFNSFHNQTKTMCTKSIQWTDSLLGVNISSSEVRSVVVISPGTIPGRVHKSYHIQTLWLVVPVARSIASSNCSSNEINSGRVHQLALANDLSRYHDDSFHEGKVHCFIAPHERDIMSESMIILRVTACNFKKDFQVMYASFCTGTTLRYTHNEISLGVASYYLLYNIY